MNPFKLPSGILILFLLFSCNKDDDDFEPLICTPNIPQFYNLNVDSYWVYQWYEIDTSGVEQLYSDNLDTIRNIKDTIINGEQYVFQSGVFLGVSITEQFLRDSSGYLVDEKGDILFSSNNFTDVLRIDTLSTQNTILMISQHQMESPDLINLTTPAGTFPCLNFQSTYQSVAPNYPWEIRTSDSYFSEGIGQIQSSVFFVNSLNTLERRLVAYQLE